MPVLKLKRIESNLQNINVFQKPKILLEQYPTTPHIAACMVHTIESRYGDIEGKVIADLGCGCGALSIGCVMLDSQKCIGYDVDPDALETCRQNLEEYEIESDDVELKEQNVLHIDPRDERWQNTVDTVIMNPPFGTKKNEGVDMHFLLVGLAMAKNAVYSLHKSTSREHLEKVCSYWGVQMFIESQLRFNIENVYKCHKSQSKDIEVDFIRFSFKKNKNKYKDWLKTNFQMPC